MLGRSWKSGNSKTHYLFLRVPEGMSRTESQRGLYGVRESKGERNRERERRMEGRQAEAGVGEPKFRFRSGELNWVNFAAEPNFPPTLSSRFSSSLLLPLLLCSWPLALACCPLRRRTRRQKVRNNSPSQPFPGPFRRRDQGWECPNPDTDTGHHNWTSFLFSAFFLLQFTTKFLLSLLALLHMGILFVVWS